MQNKNVKRDIDNITNNPYEFASHTNFKKLVNRLGYAGYLLDVDRYGKEFVYTGNIAKLNNSIDFKTSKVFNPIKAKNTYKNIVKNNPALKEFAIDLHKYGWDEMSNDEKLYRKYHKYIDDMDSNTIAKLIKLEGAF